MALSQSDLEAFKEFEKSGWDRAADPYHHHWGKLSQQSAEPLLDAAKVVAGRKVLDVATGAGYIAAAAAKRGAQAIGLDFSDSQVQLARRTYPDVEFRRGDAEDLPFDADTFDALVVGFGINHLPDPEAAFAEAFRVLKTNGYFAFTVWAAPEENPGFSVVLGAIEKYGEPNARLPPAPPYFRFASRDETRRALEKIGFVEPCSQLVPQYWHHHSPDDVFDAFNEGAVRATAMLRSQPDKARKKIREVVQNEVTKFRKGEEYIVPVPAVLSSARKP
jgi:ubiquinone/menaquinone biosynthesis C-methylase UbiE